MYVTYIKGLGSRGPLSINTQYNSFAVISTDLKLGAWTALTKTCLRLYSPG